MSYNFTTLDDPSGSQGTAASGINNAGQIVGLFQDGLGNHGFLYSGGHDKSSAQVSGISEHKGNDGLPRVQ